MLFANILDGKLKAATCSCKLLVLTTALRESKGMLNTEMGFFWNYVLFPGALGF